MSDAGYDRLTQMDNTFLITEEAQPNAPMHVASTQIHEAAPLRRDDGAIDIERIEEYVLSRLDGIPRYRQRIRRTPIEGHPIWVDDASFNIHYHVRHTRLPHPGTERQLKRMVGRIFTQRLDREKPLWEMWVIEGLEGDRIAIHSKVHHCMVDGVAGSELIAALLTPEPQDKPAPPSTWKPRRVPSSISLGVAEIARVASAPASIGSAALRFLRDEDDTRHEWGERMRATARLFSDSGGTTPVPFNRAIGPHRRIDWIPLPFDEVRNIGRALGATVNDVVLATAAGAFGHYLSHVRGVSLDALDFRVMTPVSVRSDAEKGALGNRVSSWNVELPVAEPDPIARVAFIQKETAELKESHSALGMQTIGEVTEWTGAGILSLGARLSTLGTAFNSVITNVPGPRVPLFLLRSRLLELHPHVPLMGTMGVGIALFSYDGTLSWGFSADWDLVPDLHQLITATENAFGELRAAVD